MKEEKKTFYYTFIIHCYTQTDTNGKPKEGISWLVYKTKQQSGGKKKVLVWFGLVLISPAKTQLKQQYIEEVWLNRTSYQTSLVTSERKAKTTLHYIIQLKWLQWKCSTWQDQIPRIWNNLYNLAKPITDFWWSRTLTKLQNCILRKQATAMSKNRHKKAHPRILKEALLRMVNT